MVLSSRERLISEITRQSSTPETRNPVTRFKSIDTIKRRGGGSSGYQSNISEEELQQQEEDQLQQERLRLQSEQERKKEVVKKILEPTPIQQPKTFLERARDNIKSTPLSDDQKRSLSQEEGNAKIKTFSNVAAVGSPVGSLIGVGSLGFGSNFAKEFSSGVTEGQILQFKEHPVQSAALLGVGGALGVATRFGAAGATATGAVLGGTRGAFIAQKTFQIGEIAGGGVLAGLVALEKAPLVYSQKDNARGLGNIFGETTSQIGIAGTGGVIGSKIAGIGIGFVRTRGLKRFSKYDIIAPEYFEGENFPSVKKGTTAKQLKGEFYDPIGSLGEVGYKPRAFSGRDSPLYDKTVAGKPRRGEIGGVFGSPRLNPTFLRLPKGGSPKIFSFGGGGGLPGAYRISLPSIEYAPGLKPSSVLPQKANFNPSLITKEIQGTGRAILPGIKTEKELVIAGNSLISNPKKIGYFNFQFERIPIFQTEVLGSGGGILSQTPKTFSQLPSSSLPNSGISLGSSAGSLAASSSVYDGVGMGNIAVGTSLLRDAGRSFYPIPTPRKYAPLSSGSSGKSSRSPYDFFSDYPKSPKSSPISIIRSKTRVPTISSSNYYGSSLSSIKSNFRSGNFIPGLGFPYTGRSRIKIGKRKYKRRPSLASAALGITGDIVPRLEKTGIFERPIPRRKRRRKRN